MANYTDRDVAVIIPARLSSTRLPEKCLLQLGKYNLIQRVFLKAREAFPRVIVACDDLRIKKSVEDIDGTAVLTPADCRSGTDRVAVVAKDLTERLIVNVQGDEPFINPAVIRKAVEPFFSDQSLEMGTIATQVKVGKAAVNHNQVKVVLDQSGNALYFSRNLIPFPRDSADVETLAHIGLYVYNRNFLLEFAGWPEGKLESLEKLEQLRVLERGHRIRVVVTEYQGFGIDTMEDYRKALEIIVKEKL
ncbi:MAG: 3-deoxy-manno-octulosonate cytidylyltransferase [Candidatus Wallbacteria bacterium]|nr:3-deoxy-manno-octulosonate cytidylyltransferase [Candidatus Wallbacteria bacterium]